MVLLPQGKHHTETQLEELPLKSLTAKHPIGVSTWNVRTLHQDGHLEHLIHELDHLQWEVMGISETHWCDSGELRRDGYLFLCSGNDSIHREGVAIILNKTAQRSLIGYNPVSERIISVRLRTQIGATTIVQVYTVKIVSWCHI